MKQVTHERATESSRQQRARCAPNTHLHLNSIVATECLQANAKRKR